MASRTGNKSKGLDSEICKCRDESNWRKLLDMAEQLRQRVGQHSGHFADLLVGESKLEIYLEENPPVEQNISKARISLTEAKRYLTECTKAECAKSNFVTDARFLLAKCCYAQGQYEQAIDHLSQGGIDRLEARPVGARMLKIFAESFAVKGLCLEQQVKAVSANTDEIVKCYIQAGEIGLKYLQLVEKSQGIQGATVQVTPGGLPTAGGAVTTEFRIGILLETALQRAPILMMKAGQIREAVDQYRSVLCAQETTSTQSLRMTLARNLAEVLLRGVCEHEWQQIQPQREQKRSSRYWKPQYYCGGSLYVPGEHIEEILLLLSISDAIAVRNVVLDRSPDVAQDRAQSIKNVTAVLDLLSITLARNGQFRLLCENFEKVAKFSCEEYHIWNQFGLGLIAAGSYYRGVRMLLESAKLRPNCGFDLLLAAKVTLFNLDDPTQALELIELAIDREQKKLDSDILAVSYTLKGLAHEVLADLTTCRKLKQEHKVKAFKAFIRAKQIDPDYFQADYLLGLHYANVHQIDAAMACAKRVLSLAPDFFPGIQLLIVLLTAQKKHEEALQLVQLSFVEYPDNLNLLYLKVYLEDYLYGPQKALYTAGEMLQQWKLLYEDYLRLKQASRSNGLAPTTIGTSSQLGLAPLANAHSGRGSVLGSHWVEREGSVTTKLDRSLSEALGKLTPGARRPHIDENTMLQMQMHIWLLTAKLYIKIEHFSEAEQSIAEAANVLPLSPHVLLVRGLLHNARNEYTEAKKCFETTLSVQPNNVSALQHLGLVYHHLGSHQLAEATLQSAALIEPMSATTWFYLGKVLQESGATSEASECFESAVQLELCTPILEFTKLPRTL